MRAQALVGIDEFSALGSDNVGSLLARGREAGVSVLLATQELADLDRVARGLRDQVLGNTALKIAHRQEVPDPRRSSPAWPAPAALGAHRTSCDRGRQRSSARRARRSGWSSAMSSRRSRSARWGPARRC